MQAIALCKTTNHDSHYQKFFIIKFVWIYLYCCSTHDVIICIYNINIWHSLKLFLQTFLEKNYANSDEDSMERFMLLI